MARSVSPFGQLAAVPRQAGRGTATTQPSVNRLFAGKTEENINLFRTSSDASSGPLFDVRAGNPTGE
jgi:hypothetical protein